jgi:large subunit ribosomal protein L29
MKSNEIRNLSQEEIAAEVSKRREELFDLRLQSTVGQVPDTKLIRRKKREIARLLTIAGEKTSAIEKGRA